MTCWQNECLSRTLKSEELVFDALQYHQLPKTFQSKISHAFMKEKKECLGTRHLWRALLAPPPLCAH